MRFIIIKRWFIRLRMFIYNKIHDLEWLFSSNRKNNSCLDCSKRDPSIIVSLTSFPERINYVHKTIRTILNQDKIKPNEVELWLAKTQFLKRERDLPQRILTLKKWGLKICWCDDLKSYKKLVPVLKYHPDSIIVTADDDVYYDRTWLMLLYNEYLSDPNSIQCHRVTKFYIQEGKFKTIPGGYQYYNNASFLNKLVGVGGVLYPPYSLYEDIIKIDLFMNLAPTNDDIWFWFMAILNKRRIHVVKYNKPQPLDIYEANSSPKLTTINDNGKKLFWVQFKQLIEYYPQVKTALEIEYYEYQRNFSCLK